ncbi:MAG: Hsp20 family protein, partial [Ktedonobacterales bacterium]
AQVRYGPFRADIALPMAVRLDDVAATYRDGFLRVTLPKVTVSDPPSASTPKQREKGDGAQGARSGSSRDAAPVGVGNVGIVGIL